MAHSSRRPRRRMATTSAGATRGFTSFSPDDSKWRSTAFPRVPTWKHYPVECRRYLDPHSKPARPTTYQQSGAGHCPMWGRTTKFIYLDRDGRMNLFVVDLPKATKQLTTSRFRHQISVDRVRFDRFRRTGYIWAYDLKSGQRRRCRSRSRKISDGRSALVDASKHIESVNLAPMASEQSWSRAAIFFGSGKGRYPRQLAKTSNARARRGLDRPMEMDRLQLGCHRETIVCRAARWKGDAVQRQRADTYYMRQNGHPTARSCSERSFATAGVMSMLDRR